MDAIIRELTVMPPGSRGGVTPNYTFRGRNAKNPNIAPTQAVHDRMPVILKPEDYARWLDPEEQRRTEALVRLLAPLPDDWLSAQPVGKLVNNPRNEDPRCIERRP